MQYAMQNSDWHKILLSDSSPKADLFHSAMHNLLSKLKMLSGPQSYMESNSASDW